MFKTPILCDRRIYDKKGKWKSPNNDIAENVFYFIKEPETWIPVYVSGREELKSRITIVIFGGKPLIKDDIITLESGSKRKVITFSPTYIESNILVKDMLKPRIGSMEVSLE